MKLLINSVQMKAVDQYTIEEIGIPAIVLMERAALAVAGKVKEIAASESKILAICGTGNNGADGIAAARILKLSGFSVDILLIGDEAKATDLFKQQINIVEKLGISIFNNIEINEYTIIIDAIFGIGLSRNVTGIYKDTIEKINALGKTVISVDIPSGLSADTAKPLGCAVKADYTVTFGINKIGMVLYPGCEYAGKVIVSDIGFPISAYDSVNTNYFTYDKEDLVNLPPRKDYSNKGTFGKVLIIAGSINMNGACYFSAKAAYRAGAGLVKILTEAGNRTIIQTQLPEALLFTYDSNSLEENELDEIIKEIRWATVIVIGPGMGSGKISEKLLDLVMKHAKVPVIMDADAINILAKKENLLDSKSNTKRNRIESLSSYLPESTILTPHLKEAAGLFGLSLEEIRDNLLDTCDYCTADNHLIFALKDAKTLVAWDKKRYINLSGNNGMATGGSGDVLTGIIAGLIAQGMEPFPAAVMGVYLHGLAGDKASEMKSKYAVIASDIIDAISEVLK